MTNTVLLSSAVSALSAALDSGVKAESAIVSTVKAVAFMATDKMGRLMLDGEHDAKSALSTAFKETYVQVLKKLINQGKRVYRDSEASFAEHVKGKKDAERAKGVNSYMKANKGKDVVWTVGQVSSLSRKVLAEITSERHADFCRYFAGIESLAAQIEVFEEFFSSNFGATYKELTASFAKVSVKSEASDSVIKAIGKIKDLAILEAIQSALSAHIEATRLNADKLEAVLPSTDTDEGQFDDVIQFPIAA